MLYPKEEKEMIWNMLLLAGAVAAWVILNRWVLPKFGIRT